jgi:hypothetical protein
MSENEGFCHLIESSLSDRRSKGYYDLFSHEELLDPIKMLNGFRAYEGNPPIPHYPPDVAEKTGGYPELKEISNVRYNDLKKVAESYPEIMGEVSALETIWKEYRQMFENRMKTLTPTQDIRADKAAEFIRSFLEITKGKHLFEGQFRFVDVGTGSGAFAREFVKYITENFANPTIILTNPSEMKIKDELKKSATIYDATKGPLADLILIEGPANIVIAKDVMKFFDPETKGIIWNNVTSVLAKGGVIVDGSTLFVPRESAYKAHVMNNGELVKIDFDKFLNELRNPELKDYRAYLNNLDEILKRSSMLRNNH